MTQGFRLDGTEFAIIGLAGRTAEAPNIDAFWTLLRSGATAVRKHAHGNSKKDYVPFAARLDAVFDFDNTFFDIGPSEALAMDPQHRHLLEIGQLALADGGYDQSIGRPVCGVFAGVSPNTYSAQLHRHAGASGKVQLDARDMTGLLGAEKDFSATRLAYKLGLEGPCLNVQTACSTGLSAVHVACQSIMAGDCNMALVAAAGIRHVVNEGYIWQSGGIYSKSGRCAAFDSSADGCVPGNGVFAVLLRPLEEALVARDPIRAVIRGSAINNDGRRKAGFAAPSCHGQIEVIQAALEAAGMDPAQIDAYETHGTGTPLGDPVEFAALRDVFSSARETPLKLGTLKPVIGHLDAAAGLASLVKAVLCLQKRFLPALVNFAKENPELGEADMIELPRRPSLMPQDRLGNVAVTALGVGGTNATVVLSGWDQPTPELVPEHMHRTAIVLSAPDNERLQRLAGNLALSIASRPNLDLRDISGTLAYGRSHRAVRQVWLVENVAQLVQHLKAFADSGRAEEEQGNLPSSLKQWLENGEANFAEFVPEPGTFQRLNLSADAFIPARFNALDQATAKPIIVAGRQPQEPVGVGFVRYTWQEVHPVKLPHRANDAIIIMHPNPKRGHEFMEAHLKAGAISAQSLPIAASADALRGALATCAGAESLRIILHITDEAGPNDRLQAWIKSSEATAIHGPIAAIQSVLNYKNINQPTHVVLVTSKRNTVDGLVNPLSWGAEGLFSVLPMETNLWTSQLDTMDLDQTHDPLLVDVASRIAPADTLRLGRNQLDRRVIDHIIDEAALADQPLDLAGPVMVLGGTGGIGTQIVRRLVKDAPKAQIVALGSKPLHCHAFADWNYASAALSRISNQALSEAEPELINDNPAVVEQLNLYCAGGIAAYWEQAGFGHGCAPFSRDGFVAKAKILPEFGRMIDFQIHFLQKMKMITRCEDGTYTWINRPPDSGEIAAAGQLIIEHFPDLVGVVTLLDRCFQCYRPALSGDMPAISVLYPGGSEHLMEASARAMLPRSFGQSLCQSMGHWVCETASQSDKPFRILEVGAGNGLLTEELARAAQHCSNIEILSTDIGRNLAVAGAARAAREGWKSIEFGTLDITQPGYIQGIEPGSFDLVCGLNVIHAVADVNLALKELRKSVKPGGVLSMIESVVREPWVDCVAGLAEGWWSYDDGRKFSPLLNAGQWCDRLASAGFEDTGSVFTDIPRADCDLIFGRAPQKAAAENLEVLFGYGAQDRVAVLRADLRAPSDVHRIVKQTQKRFGKVRTLVHCGGRISGALLANMSLAEIDVEFGARVHGLASVLDELDLTELAEVILSSSMNYYRGGEGQAAYVAANATVAGIGAWLDQHHKIPTTVIHWDRWNGVGLGKAFEARYAAFSRSSIHTGIEAKDALNALAFARSNRLSDTGIAYLGQGPSAAMPEIRDTGRNHLVASKTHDPIAFVEICRSILDRPGLEEESRLLDAGVDSLEILELQDKLSKEYGFDFQTGALLSETLGTLSAMMNNPNSSSASFVRTGVSSEPAVGELEGDQ